MRLRERRRRTRKKNRPRSMRFFAHHLSRVLSSSSSPRAGPLKTSQGEQHVILSRCASRGSKQSKQGKRAQTRRILLLVDGTTEGDDSIWPGRPSKDQKEKNKKLTSTTGADKILCVASVLSAASTESPGVSVTTGACLAGRTAETFDSIKSARSSSSVAPLIVFFYFLSAAAECWRG